MNKKSLLMMMLTICLIAVVGVGATLAFLSDSTGPVTNTFTFVQDGINIILDEAPIGSDNKKVDGPRVQSNDYTNIVPGMVMDKDPTVTVVKNSVNCYVFVSVTNANSDLAINDLSATWVEVSPADYGINAIANTKYYTYNATKTEDGMNLFVVEKASENNVLDAVFTEVKVADDLEPQKDADGKYINPFTNIVIKAAAVQADNCSDEEAIIAAIEMLNKTENATEDGE